MQTISVRTLLERLAVETESLADIAQMLDSHIAEGHLSPDRPSSLVSAQHIDLMRQALRDISNFLTQISVDVRPEVATNKERAKSVLKLRELQDRLIHLEEHEWESANPGEVDMF